MTTPIEKQINNLCAKIKAHYPNLYQDAGSKYIRKTLRTMLENDEAENEGQSSGGAGSSAFRKNNHRS